jgi:hypothetical protein
MMTLPGRLWVDEVDEATPFPIAPHPRQRARPRSYIKRIHLIHLIHLILSQIPVFPFAFLLPAFPFPAGKRETRECARAAAGRTGKPPRFN